jgi:hypothetical protein
MLTTLYLLVGVVAAMEMQVLGFMAAAVLVVLGQLLQPRAAVALWKRL